MPSKPKADKGPPAGTKAAATKAKPKPKATPKTTAIKTIKPKASAPLIFPKMINVMRKVGVIGKDRENPQQHYSFRGVDDVYNELHQILADEGIITIPNVLEERAEDRESSSGKTTIYRVLKIQYKFCAEDGSYVESTIIGEGMDWGDKAANKALSVGHKYCLLQMFCIPTAEPKDPEEETIEAGKKKKTHGGKKATPKGNNEKSYPAAKFPVSGEEKLLTKYQALDLFQNAKKHLGKDAYYKILGANGYEKSDQIPLEKMRGIYEEMIAAYQETISKTKTEREGEKDKWHNEKRRRNIHPVLARVIIITMPPGKRSMA